MNSPHPFDPSGTYLEQMREIPEELEGAQVGLEVSEAEFWEVWYHHPDIYYEWNNGFLEARPPGPFGASQVYLWLMMLLGDYLTSYPIGLAFGGGIGFRLAYNGYVSIRRPDYALILNSNPVPIYKRDTAFSGIYDICMEFLSFSTPSATKRDTVLKKREYEAVGVPEYYIFDYRGIETAFYRLNSQGLYQPIDLVDGEVIRSEVLPGFQFRISDLYRQPKLHTLIWDDVYRDYVQPVLQKLLKSGRGRITGDGDPALT